MPVWHSHIHTDLYTSASIAIAAICTLLPSRPSVVNASEGTQLQDYVFTWHTDWTTKVVIVGRSQREAQT